MQISAHAVLTGDAQGRLGVFGIQPNYLDLDPRRIEGLVITPTGDDRQITRGIEKFFSFIREAF